MTVSGKLFEFTFSFPFELTMADFYDKILDLNKVYR